VLRIMINDNPLHKGGATESEPASGSEAADSSAPSSGRQSLNFDRPSVSVRTPALRENVRATLAPLSPIPRALSNSRTSNDSRRSSLDVRRSSLDVRQSSLDVPRRSFDASRASSEFGHRSVSVSGSRRDDRSPMDPVRRQDSSGSPTTESIDPDTSSSAAIQSMNDTNVSASQILNRSDVFQAPTIQTPHHLHSDKPGHDRVHRASQDTARSATHRTHSPTTTAHDSLQNPRHGSVSPAIGSDPAQLQGSPSAVQSFIHATAPMQRASGIAGYLKNRSKHMSNLLATESMGYYEKVSGMWAGGSRHYGSHEGAPDDDIPDDADEKGDEYHAQRFRDHFALPPSEQLEASYFGHLQRVLPLYGKLYIGSKHLCYRSLLIGTRTKVSTSLSQSLE
jgi:sterol 3beta-glucosyltransferase